MPFTPVTYVTGGPPGLDGNAFNAMQTQFTAAINSFERDLFTPFVFSGLTATRDGVTLSQLNVTAGVAFLRQSGVNSELFRQSLSSSTQSTSGHPSTTMYLFLNPDGTWAWQTSSTPPTNALAICHVTTDGSSNIVTVVDDRTLGTTLLANMVGALALPNLSVNGTLTLTETSTSGSTVLNTILPVTPGGDQIVYGAQVAGDTGSRISMYVRGDGYGGIKGGHGAASTAFLYATASGWQTDQAFTVNNTFSVTGNSTLARITADGGNVTTDGSGNLSATTVKDGSNRVAVTGSGSTWATQAVIGIGDLAHRPAAGVKGRLYVETPFS